MRIIDHGNAVVLWLSSRDTWAWAHRHGNSWPCSDLSGHRLCAAFDSNGIYDLTIDGKYDNDCPADELSAICADFLATRIKPDHPIYYVTIGQFRNGQ